MKKKTKKIAYPFLLLFLFGLYTVGILSNSFAFAQTAYAFPFPVSEQKRNPPATASRPSISEVSILPGISQTENYFPLLQGKNVAVTTNHTGLFPEKSNITSTQRILENQELNSSHWDPLNNNSIETPVHLIDSLLHAGISIKAVFSPEHGFRSQAEAGEKVENSIDQKTGLPLISLYGSHKKPSPSELKGVDLMLIDLQDVGVRFYTYISTLHYVMEACAQAGIPVVVLDRPNPNASYIDGPVLDTHNCRSFIGLHPVPVVYGLTIGEYAQMINGEGWLENAISCDLCVIPIENYTHESIYILPVSPSPNLRSMSAIYAYPSLCFFEGTPISVGRGTFKPFECFGYPKSHIGKYRFTPQSIKGMSQNPPYEDRCCRGFEIKSKEALQNRESGKINLQYLLKMYEDYPDKANFFTPFFKKLAGTEQLSKQIRQGLLEEEIRESWKKDIESYKKIRDKYLLYM
ncbi:MAG: DUF1343 domain-containing protein [Bacteroidales bacterium]